MERIYTAGSTEHHLNSYILDPGSSRCLAAQTCRFWTSSHSFPRTLAMLAWLSVPQLVGMQRPSLSGSHCWSPSEPSYTKSFKAKAPRKHQMLKSGGPPLLFTNTVEANSTRAYFERSATRHWPPRRRPHPCVRHPHKKESVLVLILP